MKVFRRAAFGLATLGLLAMCAGVRAAVMTTTARVSSGAAPFNISYALAQDADTMTINIKRVSDNVTVRTLTSASGAIPLSATYKGPHLGEVQWDGAVTGGAPAPAGDYYAEIITTGSPVTAMTLLAGPTRVHDPSLDVSKSDGRFLYNGSVDVDPTSPYHNSYHIGGANQNGSQTGASAQPSAVYRVGADLTLMNSILSSGMLPSGNLWAVNDWLSVATTPTGGSVIAGGQTSLKMVQLNPDFTVKAVFPTAGSTVTNIIVRTIQAFGTPDAPRVYFVDSGTTGAANVGGVSLLDLSVTPTPVPVRIINTNSYAGSGRGFVVNKAETSCWIAETSATAGATKIEKYDKPAVPGDWVKDANFVFTMPAGQVVAPALRWLALSPDESTLWFTICDAGTTNTVNKALFGVVPATGAYKPGLVMTAADLGAFTGSPQTIGVTSGGNIYVTSYATVPGANTTSADFWLVAPPDTGSSDTTRSTKFSVVADTTLRFTTQPVVSNITYHGATITWDTNFASDSTVNWGTSAGAYDGTVTKDADPAPVTHHVVNVDNLEKNTKYYFQVASQEAGFTPTPLTSAEANFTTHDLTISSLTASPVLDVKATITWTTNEASTSVVHYGINPGSPDFTVTNTALVTAHSVTIANLQPLTKYYFTVETAYSSTPPTPTVSAEQNFTTLGTLRTLTMTFSTTATTATLGFTTNLAVGGTLKYGTARGALTSTVSVASGTDHSVVIPGLSAGTTYFYSMDLSAADVALVSTPETAFVTAVAGGASTSVTHSSPADFGPALRTNIDLGTAGSLLKLQKQGIPGAPVELNALPQERYYHGVAAHNGYLYVIGGRFNADTANTADTVYYAPINADGTVGTWATTTPTPTQVMALEGMCFGYNGYIYIVDAADGTFLTLNTVRYAKQNADGTLGAWQTSANIVPESRDLGAAVVYDGHVLLSGGEDNTASPSNSTKQYMAQIQANGDVGPWYQVTDIPTTRWFNKAVANAHTTYLYGGYNSAVFANQAQIATQDPNGILSGFTISPSNMTQLRYNFSAGLVAGKLVAVAGRVSPNTPVADIEYAKILPDGTIASWTAAATPSNHAVDAPDGAAYNGRIYHVGGRTVFAGGAAAAAVNSVEVIPMDADNADPDGATYAYSGTVEGQVIDLGAPTNLKHVAVSLSGGGVELRYRFANADGAFSDWFTPASLDADISGGARYFQYELVLSGAGTTTPTVNSVTLTTAAGVSPVVPYDVNKDGVVDNKDVKAALQIAAGLLNANDPSVSFANGNVVADTVMDLRDALAIERHINGR